MTTVSEGVRRLSLALGFSGVLCWAVASGMWLHTSWPALPSEPEPPSGLNVAQRYMWGRDAERVEQHRQRVDHVERIREKAFLIIGVAGLASFLLPWGAVLAGAWVKEGFREERDS